MIVDLFAYHTTPTQGPRSANVQRTSMYYSKKSSGNAQKPFLQASSLNGKKVKGHARDLVCSCDLVVFLTKGFVEVLSPLRR